MATQPATDPFAAYGGKAVDSSPDPFAAYGGKTVAAPAAQEQPKEGFLHSLGASLGITPEAGQQAAQDLKDHPIKSVLEAAAGPAYPVAKSLFEQGKASFNSARQAVADYRGGNKAQAAVDAIQAVPVVGPAMVKATDQYAQGDTGGEMGTLLGATAQAAPVVLGATDAGGVLRPNTSLPNMMSKFPTRAAAGEIFNQLNTKLAQQPVALTQSAAPLQRAVEIGARGGTLPGPISALLQRAQAIEPMTFTEARDYQAALSDLSASDKMALSGRMKGALAQLNHALYQDIRQSAEAGGGLGADFDKAMTQYKLASQINTGAKFIAKNGAKAVAGALGAGALYKIGQEIHER